MRIVHFLQGRPNPNGTNGGDRVIYNVAKSTAELGAEVFVVGLTAKPSLAIGRAVVLNFIPPRDPFSLPSALKEALMEIKPDFVHIHGVYTPRHARLGRWFRSKNIPYAISPHGGLMRQVLSRGRMTKTAYLALIGRTFCRGASIIHCISEAEADDVRHISGSVRAVVAPHGLAGIDPALVDKNVFRNQHSEVNGRRIFGFLGRLDPAHKGLDLVVEACAQIRSSLSNAVLILAGPDWKNRTLALRRRVIELGLQDTVLFLGPKMGQEKFDFLAGCDVFIHPSRWEAGLPFSILDALELGKPCLVSTGGFFSYFFDRHTAGVQVPPTKDGVAQGLQYMAQVSPEGLRRMGADGRRAVLREFSWHRTAQTLLDAYSLQHNVSVTGRGAQ